MSLHPQRAKQAYSLALAFRRLRRSVQSLYGMTEGPRAGSRGWWQRWKPAWLIKRCRFNYDLHRAWGLWLWAMLFVLAWSSVCLNLNTEIYQPVMKLMFDMRGDDALPELEELLTSPALGWREAHAVGTHLIVDAALQHDFTVAREEYLLLDRTRGVYQYVVRSSDEIGKSGGTRVVFDANSGELKMLDLPKTQATGDVITRWLVWLHTARVFGLPMQIFVCLMGLVITALSVTGVIIWLRKRHAQHHRVVRLQVSNQSAAA